MLEKTWCVYKHTNKVNGKCYIGITGTDPEKRWAGGLKYRQNAHFTSAIKKYGWDGFDHEILFDGLTREEAAEKEIELIAFYEATDREHGYNIALGGVGSVSVSDETREKMRHSHLGERNHNYGKPKSEEVKRKLAESNRRHNQLHPRPTGWKHTQEARAKMSAKLRGRKCPFEGKKRNSKTVDKIRWANSKPIVCVETDTIYPNARVAGAMLGICYSTISSVCNHRQGRTTAGGYHWEFAEEVPV